jgi:hypothetical protein
MSLKSRYILGEQFVNELITVLKVVATISEPSATVIVILNRHVNAVIRIGMLDIHRSRAELRTRDAPSIRTGKLQSKVLTEHAIGFHRWHNQSRPTPCTPAGEFRTVRDHSCKCYRCRGQRGGQSRDR